jgi:hypothetical protein
MRPAAILNTLFAKTNLLWSLAHSLSWAVFLPIFFALSGGEGIFSDLDPASFPMLLLGYLIIAFCEGLVESLVLRFYLPGWKLWLPASLVGALTGMPLAQFITVLRDSWQDFVFYTAIVMACVTLAQGLVLSISRRGALWWVLCKAPAAFSVVPNAILALIVSGMLSSAIYHIFSLSEAQPFAPTYALIGLFSGLGFGYLTSFGMQLALRGFNPNPPGLSLRQQLRTWQGIVLTGLLVIGLIGTLLLW